MLRGKPVRDAVLAELKKKVEGAPRPPGLAVILAGADFATTLAVGRDGCTTLEPIDYIQIVN